MIERNPAEARILLRRDFPTERLLDFTPRGRGILHSRANKVQYPRLDQRDKSHQGVIPAHCTDVRIHPKRNADPVTQFPKQDLLCKVCQTHIPGDPVLDKCTCAGSHKDYAGLRERVRRASAPSSRELKVYKEADCDQKSREETDPSECDIVQYI